MTEQDRQQAVNKQWPCNGPGGHLSNHHFRVEYCGAGRKPPGLTQVTTGLTRCAFHYLGLPNTFACTSSFRACCAKANGLASNAWNLKHRKTGSKPCWGCGQVDTKYPAQGLGARQVRPPVAARTTAALSQTLGRAARTRQPPTQLPAQRRGPLRRGARLSRWDQGTPGRRGQTPRGPTRGQQGAPHGGTFSRTGPRPYSGRRGHPSPPAGAGAGPPAGISASIGAENDWRSGSPPLSESAWSPALALR